MHLLQPLLLTIIPFFGISIGSVAPWNFVAGTDSAMYRKMMASIERVKPYLHSSEFQNDSKYIQVAKVGSGDFVFYHIDDVDLKDPLYANYKSTSGNVYIPHSNYFQNSTLYTSKISEEEDEYRAVRIPVLIKVNFNEEFHKLYYLSWVYYCEANDKIQWTNFLPEQKSYTHINPISEEFGETIGQIICSSINCEEPSEFNEEVHLPLLLHELHKCHRLRKSTQVLQEPNRDLSYWQNFPEMYNQLCKNRLKTWNSGQEALQEHHKIHEIQSKLMLECNDDVAKIINDLILDKARYSKLRFTEILLRANCKLNNFNSSKVFIHFYSGILEELSNYDTHMPNSTNSSSFEAVGCNGSNSTQMLSQIVFLTIKNLRTLDSCHSISILNGLVDYLKFRIQSAESIVGPVVLLLNPNEPNCNQDDESNDIVDKIKDDDSSFILTTTRSIISSKEVGLMHDSNNERNGEPIAASILAQHQRQAPSAISTKQKQSAHVKHSETDSSSKYINACDIQTYGGLLKILLGFQDILLNPVKYSNLTNKGKPETQAQSQPAGTLNQFPIENKDMLLNFGLGNPAFLIKSNTESNNSRPEKVKQLFSKKKSKSKSSKQNKKSSGGVSASVIITVEQEQPQSPLTSGQNAEFGQQQVISAWPNSKNVHHDNFKKSSIKHSSVESGVFEFSKSGKYKRSTVNSDNTNSQTMESELNSCRTKQCAVYQPGVSDAIVFNATLSNCFFEFWTNLHKLIEQACMEIKTILKNFSSKNPLVQKPVDVKNETCNCTIIDDERRGQTKSQLVQHLEKSLNYVKDQISNQCKDNEFTKK